MVGAQALKPGWPGRESQLGCLLGLLNMSLILPIYKMGSYQMKIMIPTL